MEDFLHVPGVEMERLRPLIGSWSILETPIAAGASTRQGSMTIRLGPGGFSLLVDEVLRGEGGTLFTHGLLFWDPKHLLYEWLLAESAHPAVVRLQGGWEGDRLLLLGRDRPSAGSLRRLRVGPLSEHAFSVEVEASSKEGRFRLVAIRAYSRRAR